MAVSMVLGLHPWTANVNDTQYLAAQRTIKTGGTYALIHPFAVGTRHFYNSYISCLLSVVHSLQFSSRTEAIERVCV